MCLVCGDRDLVHRSALVALLSALLRPTRVAEGARAERSGARAMAADAPDSGFGTPAAASPGSPSAATAAAGGALVFRGAVLGAGASRVLAVELRVLAWHELLRRALLALLAAPPERSSATNATDAHSTGLPFDGVILVSCAERPASGAVVKYALIADTSTRLLNLSTLCTLSISQ